MIYIYLPPFLTQKIPPGINRTGFLLTFPP
nr:MAG TPA: hypothetical protein [Caudoviricetes sp.]